MVARIRLGQGCELAGCLPVKLTAVYDDTAYRRSVSADELGCGMYNDVCAVLDRTNEIRGCKGIVYHKRNLMRMCNLCDCLDIYDFGIRIAECLDIYCLCIVLNGCLYCIQIENVYECCLYSVLRKCML